MHLQPEDRSRLNQFLKLQIEAGNIEQDLRTEDGQPKRARKVVQEAASGGSSRWEMIFVPDGHRGSTIAVEAPFSRPQVREGQKTFHHQESIHARGAAGQVQPVVDETMVFEEELKRYVVLSGKSTYYGLWGIAGDCDKAGIRQNFYALARKFHPDRHMHRPKCAGARQQLMGAITEAYSVLSREERRTSYDRTLAQSHMQKEEEENIGHCFRLATNYQRGGNDVARQRLQAIDHKANKKARLVTVHSSIGSAKQSCQCGILTF